MWKNRRKIESYQSGCFQRQCTPGLHNSDTVCSRELKNLILNQDRDEDDEV